MTSMRFAIQEMTEMGQRGLIFESENWEEWQALTEKMLWGTVQ
jgi:hypothetical protein